MTEFTLYNLETASEAAKALFEKSMKTFNMIPNLHAVMAEAPALLDSYQQVHNLFQSTSFNADELTVVWQTINVEHKCHYCIPAHTAIAHMMGVDASIVEAIRAESPIANKKLETLRLTTLNMVRQRGILSDSEVLRFLEAGYKKQQLLEIVLGISQKVMSNYTSHLTNIPVDEPFKQFI
jgi:alkylhydroperoxidase family enzyme